MSETKSALIVANYRYDHPALRQLVAPAEDAESLARVLSDSEVGGFEVRTLVNEPSHKISLEIESFCDNRKRDDLLLLYFSGHGIKDADGLLYFATIDTQLVQHNVRRATAVSAQFVNEVMSRSRSRRQILLLDCCYSGAFKQGMLAKGSKLVGAGEQFEGQGRIVLTASDALQYSFEGGQVEGEGVRSIFTRTLVRGLETGEADLDRDGSFSLDELYDYVYAQVSDELPEQKPTKMGYIEGKIFIAKNPRPLAAPLPAELRECLEDLRPWVRLGAVQELEKLLDASSKGLALAAQAALASLVSKDDSQQVRTAATRCLVARAGTQPTESEDASPRPAAEEARCVREKERRDQRDPYEADRGARTTTEQERLAQEKAELENPEGDRHARTEEESAQPAQKVKQEDRAGWLDRLLILGGLLRLRYLLIVGPAAALLWSAILFWPLISDSGKSRLKAQQVIWTIDINDALSKNQSNHSGFRAHLHDTKESPDVLTTAQGLTALLAQPTVGERSQNIDDAFAYIEAERRTTPNPGWPHLENETTPITEVAAWVAVAKAYAVKSTLEPSNQAVGIARSTIYRDLDLLAAQQSSDGSWSPIATGEQAKGTSRTYSVAIALWAFLEAKHTGDKELDGRFNGLAYDKVIDKSLDWLLQHYDSRRGWVPNPSRYPQGSDYYLGLTAQVLYILSLAENDFKWLKDNRTYLNAERMFVDRLEVFTDVHDASKTADDDGYVFLMVGSQRKPFPLQAWSFFSYPWTIAELHHLSGATDLDAITRLHAKMKLYGLLARFPQTESSVEACCTFEIAENLYCARVVVGPPELSK